MTTKKKADQLKITFLGASQTVTGSKFLVESKQARFLIDCGLFQGLKDLRVQNWHPLPVANSDIDAIFLTHAHIDHSGFIPVLTRDGFTGPVVCTEPTRDLCEILLPDAGRIQEEDADFANRHGFSKHKPAKPLYTEQDAYRSLRQFKTWPLNEPLTFADLKIRFIRAGHILGATSIVIEYHGRSYIFSGDIGRYQDYLELPPTTPHRGHAIIMESTYGDRLHGTASPIHEIARLVHEVYQKKSVLLIPSFALGRAQVLIYCLYQAYSKNLAPELPIFLDSPMATKITNLYEKHHDWQRLSHEETKIIFSLPHYVGSVDESKALNRRSGPFVLIASSGMLTGGRILHHVKHFGPDPDNIILLPGFQAPGTRGAQLALGATELRIHGEFVPIRSQVHHWDILSAHADQQELLRWLKGFETLPRQIFLIHGEPNALDQLRMQIKYRFDLRPDIIIPKHGESFYV